MIEEQGKLKIKQIRRNCILFSLLADALLSTAVALFSGSLLNFIIGWHWSLSLIIFIIFFTTLMVINKTWQLSAAAVCSFLNATHPELEESCHLAIKPATEYTILENLQRNRVEQALLTLPALPAFFLKKVKLMAVIAVAAAIVSFVVPQRRFIRSNTISNILQKGKNHATPEKILPQVEPVSVKIIPPAYTGRPPFTLDKFNINAPEWSVVEWTIKTNKTAGHAFLLMNGQYPVPLSSTGKTLWRATQVIIKPGFYQVSIDGRLSDLYEIQVLKDKPPVIKIITPEQYTHIDAGEAQKVNLKVNLNDDYGITAAQLIATVAKGSGEAVKFKEYRMNFGESFQPNKRKYDLQKTIDLPGLNMEPGDELYFYVQAEDNHRQITRTDAYIVSVQDTAQLLSMDGLLTGSNIKPEFFRSERQIIIETEALIKDRNTMSPEAFKNRCGDLGADQKMLRLRYGKFLGEEDESGKEGDNELAKVENFSNAQKIMDAYTDKHDNAEDASFLDPATKAQLKLTLNEMWKAELQLRLYKPADALAFEYKSLRLLKDLQQKSRSYVAKTAYNPPPFKADKRLTGDLSKVISSLNEEKLKPAADEYAELKKSLVILEQLKYSATLSLGDRVSLLAAERRLNEMAASSPASYLPSLRAITQLLAGKKTIANILVIQKALQRIIPGAQPLPYGSETTVDGGLGKAYHQNLNHLHE